MNTTPPPAARLLPDVFLQPVTAANWRATLALAVPPDEDAQAEYAGLLQRYPAHGYEVVLIPEGTPGERASFVERQLGL